MTLLVDVNLSPLWIAYFEQHSVAAVHWLGTGPMDPPDIEILSYAARHGYVILTHDLDFGALLATSGAPVPKVIQIRIQDVLPDAIGDLVLQAITAFTSELNQGALVTVTKERGRARLLPLRPMPA